MSFATPFQGRCATVALALSLSAAMILGVTPASADPTELPDLPEPTHVSAATDYIVTLADAPVAAYDGDVAGYDATQPSDGESIDLGSTDAKRYRAYLRGHQDKVAARVGTKPRERYEVGLNAFISRMTGQQAATLARTDGVVSVVRNTLHRMPDDRKSTDYLGLTGHDGVWSKLGGPNAAGRGVVVGVIDSGIWPESASFDGDPLRTTSVNRWQVETNRYQPRRVGNRIVLLKSDGGLFRGTCQTGESFTVDDCDSKLVGARYFGEKWLAEVPAGQRKDFVSPRDGTGHGSHTASIAAGNSGVRATVEDRDLGQISGVAPAAKIASYKVLWRAKNPTQSGAWESDILAAIEAAISDGVDVINFSIAAADDPTSPVQLAFLAAAKAGIFVAAAAGNSGPAASTVQSTAPWVTTVGAHTIAPHYGTLTLGNGERYAGVSTTVTEQVGPAPLVSGAAAAASGSTGANAAACAPGSLDRQRAAGAIVVCDRGVVERIVKSAEVERVGGIGMVLTNPTENTLDADLHSVPTVHVNPPASADVKAYAATPGATATLTPENQTSTRFAYPQIATFSGRGPSVGTGGDTLKPDVVAPGVSILGAVAPPSNDGLDFAFLSGTSQSAPQVAGLAALWFGAGARPTWSPMKIKSALMTTAADLVDDSGDDVTDPFAQGAGRVVPERMFTPGLVYPAGEKDWLGYLAGLSAGAKAGVEAINPSDYNAPSIAIGRLAGTQTVTRRVTAVTPGRYRVSASIPGVEVAVSPSVLNFDHAGQTKTFKVTFVRESAAFDAAASGFLTWRSRLASVRIPLVVTPRFVEAPELVAGSGAAGSLRFGVTPGRSGRFPITATGMVTGVPRPGSLTQNQYARFLVTIPAGTKAAQLTIRTPHTAANLDLGFYRVVGSQAVLVDEATTRSPNETVIATDLQAGTYFAQVDIVANAPGASATPFTFRYAAVPSGPPTGSLAVSPRNPTVTAGEPFEVTARWAGLDPVPYVGWIEYADGTGTVVSVN